MTRRLTILAVTVAIVVSFGLYRTELRVREMEKELAELNIALLEDQRTIDVLDAEWSYLNRPERLQHLAERYLMLVPPATERLGGPEQLAALPKRAPALAEQPGGDDARAPAWPAAGTVLPLPASKPAAPAGGVVLATHGGGND